MNNKIIIPVNYAIEGTAFGNIKWRNLIEGTVIFLLLAVPIYAFLPIGVKGKIYASIILVGPLVFLALHGISGLCLSEYIYYAIVFLKNRSIYTYPDSRAQIQRQKNLLKKKKRQMQIQKEEEEKQKKEKRRLARIERMEHKGRKGGKREKK